MRRAEILLLWMFAAAALLALGDKLERRSAARPEVSPSVPQTAAVCPRLRPMAGRVDLIVIDHVLVYRGCGRV